MTTKTETRYTDAAQAVVAQQGEEIAHLRGINAELLAALERAIPWLGKMIADGAHQNSVAPLDCERALAQAEAIASKAREQ
jgi:hypothetical protein